MTAKKGRASAFSWTCATLCLCAVLALSDTATAAGTTAGSVIQNTATVSFDLGGTPLSLDSNTTTITVAERLDVDVTLQSPQLLVAASDTGRSYAQPIWSDG